MSHTSPLVSFMLPGFEFVIPDTETEKGYKSSHALQGLDFGSSVYLIPPYELDCHQLWFRWCSVEVF